MTETDQFEAHREHLLGVAYRMLGSRAEAEDAVQEAWLRYAGADRTAIRDTRAWLTTATARICLDVLRSARVRREAYVGPWLPDPLVSWPDEKAVDPGDQAVRRDDVGYALLVVMERLSPDQRVAFVLHDVFAVPFGEIATVLGTTDAAARKLASRARAAIADNSPRHVRDDVAQRRVLAAFIAAAEKGDLDGLVAVLAPDAVIVSDGGGYVPAGRRPIHGAVQIGRFMAGLFRRARHEQAPIAWEWIRVNGDLGILGEIEYPAGQQIRFVMAFTVADGVITGIFDQLNPEKLAAVAELRRDQV